MNNFYALSILQESPLLFAIIASIFGLLVGSFLNVVIYRLPVMIENEWKENCAELNDENYQPSGKIFLSSATYCFEENALIAKPTFLFSTLLLSYSRQLPPLLLPITMVTVFKVLRALF
jgi:prepilin signal peptidase PulO-like enzyme (type II secretory pathway)